MHFRSTRHSRSPREGGRGGLGGREGRGWRAGVGGGPGIPGTRRPARLTALGKLFQPPLWHARCFLAPNEEGLTLLKTWQSDQPSVAADLEDARFALGCRYCPPG